MPPIIRTRSLRVASVFETEQPDAQCNFNGLIDSKFKGCGCKGICANKQCGCVKKNKLCQAEYCKCSHSLCKNQDENKENVEVVPASNDEAIEKPNDSPIKQTFVKEKRRSSLPSMSGETTNKDELPPEIQNSIHSKFVFWQQQQQQAQSLDRKETSISKVARSRRSLQENVQHYFNKSEEKDSSPLNKTNDSMVNIRIFRGNDVGGSYEWLLSDSVNFNQAFEQIFKENFPHGISTDSKF